MSGESLSSTSASSYYSAPASEGVPKPICFISHAWDNKRINEVVAAIQYALGIAFDVATDITSASGANNPQTLLANIRKASLFVCILDNLRPNVAFELGYARAHNIPFILLLYENAEVDVRSFLMRAANARSHRIRPLDERRSESTLACLKGMNLKSTRPLAPTQRIRQWLIFEVNLIYATNMHQHFEKPFIAPISNIIVFQLH